MNELIFNYQLYPLKSHHLHQLLIITERAIRIAETNWRRKETRTRGCLSFKCPKRLRAGAAIPKMKNQQTVKPSGALRLRGIAKRNIQKNLVFKSVTKFPQAAASFYFCASLCPLKKCEAKCARLYMMNTKKNATKQASLVIFAASLS